MYLLDTNVVSELRKLKPHQGVVAWVERTPEESLHLSAITVGEIQAGIERTRALDSAKASEIEEWLNLVERSYNILSLDAATFRRWAKLWRASRTSMARRCGSRTGRGGRRSSGFDGSS